MLEDSFTHLGGCIELVEDLDVERSIDIAVPGGTDVNLTDGHVDRERQARLAEREFWKELHRDNVETHEKDAWNWRLDECNKSAAGFVQF